MNSRGKVLIRARGLILALGLLTANEPGVAQGILHFTPSTPIYYSPLPAAVDLDVNSDGTTDFTLTSDGVAVNLVPRGASVIWAMLATPPDLGSYVVPLASGTSISASLDPQFTWYRANADPVGASTIIATVNLGSVGLWAHVEAYAGVDFSADGQRHFGWLHIHNYGINAGEILDWAYETAPDTAILAGAVPEPAAIILFGLMVPVLWCLFRKRRRET